MAHAAQQEFCARVKSLWPQFFRQVKVLDVGSLDINGSNRELFTDAQYVGVDIAPGKNVDVVGPIHELEISDRFDVVVSTECFEHDLHWRKSLVSIVALLREGGLFFFSCAGTGRPEHGTRARNAGDSPFTTSLEGWQDYYRNLTEADIRDAIDMNQFQSFAFEYNPSACDLYFWGIKR